MNQPITDMPESTESLHVVATSNSSSFSYAGPVACTMFFKQGEMTQAQLPNYGPDDSRPFFWAPSTVLLWPDGSVKRGQIKTFFSLAPSEIAYVKLEHGKTPLSSFVWDEVLWGKVAENILQSQTFIQCNVNGTPVYAYPYAGQWKVLRSDSASLNIRFRTHFQSGFPAQPSPLSLTTYVEIEHFSPIVKCTFVLGNDTLETPVNGGLSVTNLQVNSPVDFSIFQRGSYGSLNFDLGDGQTMAIKYLFSARQDSWAISNMNALSQSLISGFDYYPTLQEAKGISLAPLPPTRIDVNQILAAKQQADNSISFPSAEPRANLGHINLNPPSTGAQADFASTMPVDLQKATMAYCNKALSRVYLSCLRESFRPSFYWETRNGVEERCSLLNYPNLFFWSSRIHYHPSWNPNQPLWLARTGSFVPGSFGGWGSSDNQHLSNNHLRYLYQITLDPYFEDMLKYYMTIDYWDFFTAWMNSVEAERATRLVKDALELCEMFPSEPEAIVLREKIQQKMGIYNNAIQENIARFGIAGVAPFNACDPRVNNGVWCPSSGPSDIVSVGWQTGFHMELQAMSTNNLAYLDHAHHYFLPDGTPKTYFVFPSPESYVTGGIGIYWWSGWIILALKNPNHPNSSFILNSVKPLIDSHFATSGFWSSNDGWKAW